MTGNRRVKYFLSFARSHCRMCITIYVFKNTKREKKTKQENGISVANLTGYNEIVCEFALCTFTYWIES